MIPTHLPSFVAALYFIVWWLGSGLRSWNAAKDDLPALVALLTLPYVRLIRFDGWQVALGYMSWSDSPLSQQLRASLTLPSSWSPGRSPVVALVDRRCKFLKCYAMNVQVTSWTVLFVGYHFKRFLRPPSPLPSHAHSVGVLVLWYFDSEDFRFASI